MKKRTFYWIIGLLVFGAIAVALTGTAFAAVDQPTDEDTSTNENTPFIGKMRRGGRGGMYGGQVGLETAAGLLGMTVDELTAQLKAGENLADLAEKAGVELQTLRDAVESAHIEDVKAQIQQSVSDGEITQDEADWLLRGIENGFNQGFGRDNFGRTGSQSEAGLAAAASALNMDEQDLSNQLWAGRSLADIAEKAGVELQTVLDAVQAAHLEATRARIEAALENGTITQEQADWMLEGIEKGYGRSLPGLNGRDGFGSRGHGGMREMPRFHPDETTEGF